MRINVYAEELTTETEVVEKIVNDGSNYGRTFYGVRTYLLSTDVLHHTPEDDDRSAITFFVPWTCEGGHDFEVLRSVLVNLLDDLDVATEREAQRRMADDVR